jgi:hypothetical protein
MQVLGAFLLVVRDDAFEQQVVRAHRAFQVAGPAQLLGGEVGAEWGRRFERPVENFSDDGLTSDVSQGVAGGSFMESSQQLACLIGVKLPVVDLIKCATGGPGESAKVPNEPGQSDELWNVGVENPPDPFGHVGVGV